jgi:pimeloyl-ACP methyl ester carboxylesterase
MVLGFSDGGYAGFKLASMYPERVKKLIVIGASELQPGVRNFKFDAKQAVALDSAYWKQQLTLMPEPKKLQEMFTKLGDMYNRLTVGKELFFTIKCPVLVMAGDRDQSNPLQRVVNTAQMIPNSQLSIILNGTHGVFLENFPTVWASIVPFLKQ